MKMPSKSLSRVGSDVSSDIAAIQAIMPLSEYERDSWAMKNLDILRRALKDPSTPSKVIGDIILLLSHCRQWQTLKTAARHPNLSPPKDPGGARAWGLLSLYRPKDAFIALLKNKFYPLENPEVITDYVESSVIFNPDTLQAGLKPIKILTFSNFHKNTQESRWRWNYPLVVALYPHNIIAYIGYDSSYMGDTPSELQALIEAPRGYNKGPYLRVNTFRKKAEDYQKYEYNEALRNLQQTNSYMASEGLPLVDKEVIPLTFRDFLRLNDQNIDTVGGGTVVKVKSMRTSVIGKKSAMAVVGSSRQDDTNIHAKIEAFLSLLPTREASEFYVECLDDYLARWTRDESLSVSKGLLAASSKTLLRILDGKSGDVKADANNAAAIANRAVGAAGRSPQALSVMALSAGIISFSVTLTNPSLAPGYILNAMGGIWNATSSRGQSPSALRRSQWRLLQKYIRRVAGDLLTSGFVASLPRVQGPQDEVAQVALIESALHSELTWLASGAESDSDRDILSRISNGFEEVLTTEPWINALICGVDEAKNVWQYAVRACPGMMNPGNQNRSMMNGLWSDLRKLPSDEIGKKKRSSKMKIGGSGRDGYLQQLMLTSKSLRESYRLLSEHSAPNRYAYSSEIEEIYDMEKCAQHWRRFFFLLSELFRGISTGDNGLDELASAYQENFLKLSKLKRWGAIIPTPGRLGGIVFNSTLDQLWNVASGCDELLRREVSDAALMMNFSPWKTYATPSMGLYITALLTDLDPEGLGPSRDGISFISKSAVAPLNRYVKRNPSSVGANLLPGYSVGAKKKLPGKPATSATEEGEASDPNTSAARLRALTHRHGALVAANPNTPPEELQSLAEVYPEIVEGNPALGMLAIESPSWFTLIMETIEVTRALVAVEGSAKKLWPKGFSVNGWGAETLPEDTVNVPMGSGWGGPLSASLVVGRNKDHTMVVWAIPFDSRSGHPVGEVLDGRVIWNELAERLSEESVEGVRRRGKSKSGGEIIGASPFISLARLVGQFDGIPINPALSTEGNAFAAMSKVTSGKISAEDFARLAKTNAEVKTSYKIALFATATKPTITLYQVRPGAAKLVNNTQVNYMPSEPPRLIRYPGMIEARRPEQGERLVGDVVAIAWWMDGGALNLLAQTAGTPEVPTGIVFSWIWYVSWSGEEMPNHMDLSDHASMIRQADVGRMSSVALAAQRFLITFGIILTAEASPFQVDQEKTHAKKGSRPTPGSSTWVTRHIFLSEQQQKRVNSPTKEDRETAAREGLTLEEVAVRGFIRRQRHGPGHSLVKEIWIPGFLSHRWVSPDKNRRIVVH